MKYIGYKLTTFCVEVLLQIRQSFLPETLLSIMWITYVLIAHNVFEL
jgi:hypothetical protein